MNSTAGRCIRVVLLVLQTVCIVLETMVTDTVNTAPLPKFPNPFFCPDYADTGFPMRTLNEKAVDGFSAAIRVKPRWWEKVHDETIVGKWRAEFLQQNSKEALFELCIQQLRFLATKITEGGVRPSPVNRVFESDAVLDEELRSSVLQALRPLEEVPKGEKDWHPGSNNQVLDLVHPSLYPLVYGLSRRINVQLPAADAPSNGGEENAAGSSEPPVGTSAEANSSAAGSDAIQAAFRNWKTYMGSGAVVQTPELAHDPNNPWVARHDKQFRSDKFQWLPTDILVKQDGAIQFLSYINNVHPEHNAELYTATAKLLQRCIPLFETTLATAVTPVKLLIEPKYELWESMSTFAARIGREEGDSESEDLYDLYEDDKQYIEPPIPEWSEPVNKTPEVSLTGRGLQVIIKYASIVLTPDNPEYKGGVWHVEGMKNESIVASAIAYLRCDNITTSRLAFRTMVDEPEYEQSDHQGVGMQYGVSDEDRLVDVIGAVECTEGRVVAFSNVFQHLVKPFKLEDSSKPGLRTIAAIFLVDPNKRILSTADIPPQQLSWHNEASSLPSLLPAEVQEVLDTKRDFPLPLEKAKELREELMKERKYLHEENKDEWFEREFSLCEH